MPNHHPDIATLTEYSAGALSPAVSACVSAHLEFCVQCRSQVAKLNSVGGELLEFIPAAELAPLASDIRVSQNTLTANDVALDQVFATIDALPEDAVPAVTSPSTPSSAFEGIEDILSGSVKTLISYTQMKSTLSWNKLSASLSVAKLLVGDASRELALHRLRSGGGVSNHNHRDEEVTVVLCGSFSDQNGLYTAGDFLVKQPGDVHSPQASTDGDCICLSAMAAPVKFTGLLTRLLNPFLKISPSVG